MLDTVVLIPGSALERALVAVFVCLALVAAGGVRQTTAFLPRNGLWLAAYLAGSAALLLGAHALCGARTLELSPYAAMLAVSVLIAWSLAVPRLLSSGLPLTLVFYMIFGCLVLGVVGSRLANVLDDGRGGLSAMPTRLADRGAGLGVFGAVILDTLFLTLLFRRYPQHSIGSALDASATAIGVNVGLGRVGCLLGGCCFGAATDPGLLTIPAHAFQPGSPAGIAYATNSDAHVWATQPMEAVAVLSITLGCEFLYRKRQRLGLRNGSIIAALALAYGTCRAVLESIRADSPRLLLGAFTSWQMLGVGLAIGAALWLLLCGRIDSRLQPIAATERPSQKG